MLIHNNNSLSKIDELVQLKANESTKKILSDVFNSLFREHKKGHYKGNCSCDYCKTLIERRERLKYTPSTDELKLKRTLLGML